MIVQKGLGVDMSNTVLAQLVCMEALLGEDKEERDAVVDTGGDEEVQRVREGRSQLMICRMFLV